MTIVAFGISGVSLLVIPFIDLMPEGIQRVVAIAVAVLFWAGIVFGFVLVCCVHFSMREMRYKADVMDKFSISRIPGVIRLSNQLPQVILYAVILIGMTCLITDIIWRWIPPILFYPIVSITFLLFAFHSIIDGNNFKAYITIKEGVRNGYKKKKEND